MPKPHINICRFDRHSADHKSAFKALNIRWLETFFVVEPVDEKVLSDPGTYILEPGGEIWMAEVDGVAMGCVALKPAGDTAADRVYELTKLAVDPAAQGLGIGKRLMLMAQDRALALNARKLFLESNDSLVTARQLYLSLGWQDATPPEPSPYQRANVYMVWHPQLADIEIIEPQAAADLEAVKSLFIAYARQLDIDLCFQGFEEEMESFPAKYDLLLLAKKHGQPVGAVGIWTLENSVCEMKRLYVDPKARGDLLGRRLSLVLMERAAQMGFKTMKLDTLARLKPAVSLYRDLGFLETSAYNHNPEDDILYFERTLCT